MSQADKSEKKTRPQWCLLPGGQAATRQKQRDYGTKQKAQLKNATQIIEIHKYETYMSHSNPDPEHTEYRGGQPEQNFLFLLCQNHHFTRFTVI